MLLGATWLHVLARANAGARHRLGCRHRWRPAGSTRHPRLVCALRFHATLLTRRLASTFPAADGEQRRGLFGIDAIHHDDLFKRLRDYHAH
jgi:hypothetical protein